MQRDDAYLLDIFLAAREALEFSASLTWETFQQSRLHQLAIMRALEIVGEAARQLSQETREAHPEIPWHQLIGLRNRLAHEYLDIDLAVVWDVVRNDVSKLIAAIAPLIPPEK